MAVQLKNVAPTYEQLVAFLQSSYYCEFNLANFQRKNRKFFKFSIFDNTLFFMRSRISKHSVKIQVQSDNYFRVTSSKVPGVFELHALSGRELVTKMLHHELF